MIKERLAKGLHGLTLEDFFPTEEVWADEDEVILNNLKAALFLFEPSQTLRHEPAPELV